MSFDFIWWVALVAFIIMAIFFNRHKREKKGQEEETLYRAAFHGIDPIRALELYNTLKQNNKFISEYHKVTTILQVTVDSLNSLAAKEPFPVYKHLRDKYQTLLTDYKQTRNLQSLEQGVRFTSRMLQEAPPNDDAAGLQLLNQIAVLYSYLPH